MKSQVAASDPTTVIAVGTFDLFHEGHLAFLQRASALGERLVVGVRSDRLAFTRKREFPYFVERERLALVNNLKCVSACFLVIEEGAEQRYIDEHRAHVFAAGEDKRGRYNHLSVREVAYLPRLPSIETSSIIRRIRDQPFTVRNGVHYRIGCTEHFIKAKRIIVEGKPEADTLESQKESELLRIVECLAKVHEVFTKHGIEYSIMAGTLLGAVRHRGIIPWDDDGDVLVDKRGYDRIEERFTELRRDFAPFEIVVGTAGYKVGIQDVFPCDIVVFDIDPDDPRMLVAAGPFENGRSTFEMKDWQPNCRYKKADVFPVKPYQFEHLELYGPANAEGLLLAEYNERALDELLYAPALVKLHQMVSRKWVRHELLMSNVLRHGLPALLSKPLFKAMAAAMRRTYYKGFNK